MHYPNRYADNLEELTGKRTEEAKDAKDKADKLLKSLLPHSTAEALLVDYLIRKLHLYNELCVYFFRKVFI